MSYSKQEIDAEIARRQSPKINTSAYSTKDIDDEISRRERATAPEDLGNFLEKVAKGSVTEVPGFFKQAFKFPYEASQYIGSGLNPEQEPRFTKNVKEGAYNAVNSLSTLAKYLGSKGILNKNVYEQLLKEEQEHKRPNFNLGAPQAGDILAQLATEAVIPGGGVVSKAKLPRSASGHGLEFLKNELQKNKIIEEHLKELASNEFKTTKPYKLEHLAEQEHEANKNAYGVLREIPEENIANRLPSPTGENLVPEAKATHEQALEQFKNTVGNEEPHGQNFAQAITDQLSGKQVLNEKGNLVREGGLKQELGNEFQSIDEDFAGKTVKMPKKINKKEIDKLIPEYLTEHSNPISVESFRKEMKHYLESQAPHTEMDAQQLYRKYRTLTMQATADKSKSFGLSPEDHYKWQGIAAAKEAEAANIEHLLKSQVGGDWIPRLDKIKDRWHKEYAPLEENNLYLKMRDKGKVGKIDLFEGLSGTGKGQDIMNKAIMANPDLIKHILGHQFKQNPKYILEPSKLANKYINAHPEIKNIVEHMRESLGGIKTAEQRAKQLSKESTRTERAYEEDVANQNKRKKAELEIPERQQRISRALTLAQQQKIASKKSATTQKQIDDLVESMKKSGVIKRILVGASKTASTAGITAAAYQISRKLVDELTE